MNTQQKQQTGFTIIEVILVLAIAALIFLMVFIAVPALNAGQRDTARKQDVGTIASAVTSYVSNNQGSFPTTAQLKSYVQNVSQNTDTTKLTVQASGTLTAAVQASYVIVTQGTKCSATGAAAGSPPSATETLSATGVTKTQFTVVTYLEGGGGTSFCQDS